MHISLAGRLGSGKSTLLSILAGNLRPDAGRVMLDGHDLTAMRERELARVRRTSLGFVYQSLNLVPTLNGEDNILLTGDLEKEGELSLIEKNDLPKVTLYKAGHHGSKTSSNECLLEVIQPEQVLILETAPKIITMQKITI